VRRVLVTSLDVVASIPPGPAGAVSDRRVMLAARALRVLSAVLLGGLCLVIAGSVLAFGSVYIWAHPPLFYATGVLVLIALARIATIVYLRRRLGRSQFAFHSSGRWLVLDVEEPYGIRTWSFDLDRPLVRIPPLVLPGVLFVAWVVIQMIPLPAALADALSGAEVLPGAEPTTDWRTVTVSMRRTTIGLSFLCWAIVLHLVAGIALARHDDQRVFRRFVAGLGLVLAAVGLIQMATRTRRVYWFWKPVQGDGEVIFGPFMNRDHFGFYMLMVTAIAFGVLAEAYRRYQKRVGARANLRRQAVALASPAGVSLVYSSVPALAAAGSLIATTSRGALLSFLASVAVAAMVLIRRRTAAAAAGAVIVTLAVLSWFGLARIHQRMNAAPDDASGRTIVWEDTLARMGGRWLAGSGLNTFDRAMSGATAWELPDGATPWSGPYETSFVGLAHAGYRFIEKSPDLLWYGTAHNDYVQILAETGTVGLLLMVWAFGRAFVAVRSDAWLLAALVAPALHAFLDFGFQLPGVVALFVSLAAIRPHAHGG
jgi:O-antigen ligase